MSRDEIRLDSFHHRCLRAMLRVSRWDQLLEHITNLAMRKRWGDVGLPFDIVRMRRLQWLVHVARMPDDGLPKKILFGWLPQTRPPHGPRLRWKDRVHSDLQRLNVQDWFAQSADREKWRAVCHTLSEPTTATSKSTVTCSVCQREFKSQSGLKRHKCSAARKLPIPAQPGAVQCTKCQRWFRSRGGLAVHKCRLNPEGERQPQEQQQAQEPSVDRQAISTMSCCSHHCNKCLRCFKSQPGFNRHNCNRGRRPTDRSSFSVVCSACERRFRFERDLKRHKCSADKPG